MANSSSALFRGEHFALANTIQSASQLDSASAHVVGSTSVEDRTDQLHLALGSLTVGDHVAVKSSSKIRATLNDEFLNRGLYFNTDMLNHCGHRYCIRAVVRQLIDIVTGEMRKMKTPAYILRDVHFSGERQLFNAQYEQLFWRCVWLRQDEN